ncbi:hypothetical protein [Thermus sp.]|uniref:hypothetical protein n=1 Tax=Thermus sp. TaxID=275 RepID=UPI00307EB2A1
MIWQRTGDPLGDFIRLVQLLEEALERAGAPKDGTLGQKLNSEPVQDFLQGMREPQVEEGLYRLLEARNRVIHGRAEVPLWTLKEGPLLLARLLRHLELKGFYGREEAEARYAFLKQAPPPPAPEPEPIAPAYARAPFTRPPGKAPTPIPKRRFRLRALLLPQRRLW